MVRIVLLIAFVCLFSAGQGQRKHEGYRIKVTTSNAMVFIGNLLALNDSSVSLVSWSRPRGDTVLMIADIRTIALRLKNAPTRGLLAGAGIGAAFTAMVAAITYTTSDCDGVFCYSPGPGEVALFAGLLGGLVGGLIGSASGSVYKTFVIDGDMRKYTDMNNRIAIWHLRKGRARVRAAAGG